MSLVIWRDSQTLAMSPNTNTPSGASVHAGFDAAGVSNHDINSIVSKSNAIVASPLPPVACA